MSKYVKRHHPTTQIIGDKYARPMTKNKLRSESGLLSMKQPKSVKDTLEDDDCSKFMKEEIENFEKNKNMESIS